MSYASKRSISREQSSGTRRLRGHHSKGYKKKAINLPQGSKSSNRCFLIEDEVLRLVTSDVEVPDGATTVVYNEVQMRAIGKLLNYPPTAPLTLLAQEIYDLGKGLEFADAHAQIEALSKEQQTEARALMGGDDISPSLPENLVFPNYEGDLLGPEHTADARATIARQFDYALKKTMNRFAAIEGASDETVALLDQYSHAEDTLERARLEGVLAAISPGALDLYNFCARVRGMVEEQRLYLDLGFQNFEAYLVHLTTWDGTLEGDDGVITQRGIGSKMPIHVEEEEVPPPPFVAGSKMPIVDEEVLNG